MKPDLQEIASGVEARGKGVWRRLSGVFAKIKVKITEGEKWSVHYREGLERWRRTNRISHGKFNKRVAGLLPKQADLYAGRYALKRAGVIVAVAAVGDDPIEQDPSDGVVGTDEDLEQLLEYDRAVDQICVLRAELEEDEDEELEELEGNSASGSATASSSPS